MFQSLFEKTLEENVLVFIQFAFPPEAIVLPLARVLVDSIEPITPITASLSFDKLAFVDIAVVIDCFAKPMRLRCNPGSAILLKIVILDRLELVHSLPMGLALHELSFIGGSISKFEQTISLLFIILPIAVIHITIGIPVYTVSMFGFTKQGSLIGISVAQLN